MCLVPLWLRLVSQSLKKYKSPWTSAEIIQASEETLCFENHKLNELCVNSVWNEEELHQHWKESITVPIYKKGDTN